MIFNFLTELLFTLFVQKPATDKAMSPPVSPGGIGGDGEKPEYCLIDSLLVLTKSEVKKKVKMIFNIYI